MYSVFTLLAYLLRKKYEYQLRAENTRWRRG